MTLKLYYWNYKGRAQLIRTLLKHLNVEYEEINPTKDNWQGTSKAFLEGGFHFPNLSMIEDGDLKLSESGAILRYIAAK